TPAGPSQAPTALSWNGLGRFRTSLIGVDQPQTDGQRFAEHLALFLTFQLRHFLDHPHPMRRDREGAQHPEHALAVTLADGQGALPAAARELGQTEAPGEALMRVAGPA